MDEKKIKLRKLSYLYAFIIFLTIVLVWPPHVFPQPYFMPLRFPHYLEMMGPFLGVSWPVSFEIYHWIILIIGAIGAINVLGLVFSNMKPLAKLSSLIGLFLFSFMILFFFFPFMKVNSPTSIIYGLYFMVLLIVDLLTFKVLIMPKKEA